MSVEKLRDSSNVSLQEIPYVQVSNHVCEHIKNNDAFRVWVFCLSKTTTWKVIKEYTSKMCGLGEDKTKQVWSYLARCNLIEYIKHRDEKGKIVSTDIRILNGSRFDKDVEYINKKSTSVKNPPQAKTHRCEKPAAGKTTRVENTPLLNKDKTLNKDSIRKKEKSFYADEQKKSKSEWKEENAKQHAFAESMNQMENERRHIEEHERRKRFETGTPMPDKIRAEIKRALGKSAYGWRSMYV